MRCVPAFDPRRSSMGLPVQLHLFDVQLFAITYKLRAGDRWHKTEPMPRRGVEAEWRWFVASGCEAHIAPAGVHRTERLEWPRPVALGYDVMIKRPEAPADTLWKDA